MTIPPSMASSDRDMGEGLGGKHTRGPWKAEPMVPLANNAFYITASPDGNDPDAAFEREGDRVRRELEEWCREHPFRVRAMPLSEARAAAASRWSLFHVSSAASIAIAVFCVVYFGGQLLRVVLS